jgi:Transposase DDE domain
MSEGRSFCGKKSIRNWPEYNAGLVKRYDVTVHIDPAALQKPLPVEGRRGRPLEYSRGLIEMGLVIKAVYRLPYRGLEGFLRSVLEPGVALPDYTTFCLRADGATDKILKLAQRGGPVHMVVDTTGLKVFGEGEWKVRQHGASKRRTWRKLHLALDEKTQEILVADLTFNSTGDQEHLPALLDDVPDGIALDQVTADGIYDSHACYKAVDEKGAVLVTPPRLNSRLPRGRPRRHEPLRTRALRTCKRMGRTRWKIAHRYHRRSLAETAMYRFKTSFGGRLASRIYEKQTTEALIKAKTLNTFRRLAAPAY